MSLRICGLDLSINSSGVVIFELDNKGEITHSQYFGFSSVKKNCNDKIVHYRLKDFANEYQKFNFTASYIYKWCKDCDYIAVEDYSFGSSQSRVFNIAENGGIIKYSLLKTGAKMRLYSPNSVKKHFSGYGLSDKVSMYNAFKAHQGEKFDISDLPIVNNGRGVSPTSDVIDAFAICDMLRTELKIRGGLLKLEELNKARHESLKVYVQTEFCYI